MDDLISRQAVIEMLDETRRIAERNIDGAVLMTFEKVLDSLVNITNALPTIQPEPHWIPVTKDTLPERNRVVVVCGEKGTWDFGTYRGHGNDIHYWDWKKNTYKIVYWWMYKEDALPEPFKGVTT